MADSSITLNSGSGGAVVDTRTTTGAEHRQVVVIGEGAATSDAVIPGDVTNGLLTNPSDRAARDCGKVDIAAFDVALPAGTNNIGDVDVLSSALPTGAATAAKQPALGTAGTASTDVITIQGIASMTKVLVTPDSVALPANQSVNVSQINGVTPLMGAGNTGTGSPRVTIASDQAAVPTTPGGNVAHDAADSGSPIKVGFKVETSPKGITLPVDGDRTDAYADADGMQMVKLNTSGADVISEAVSNTDGASTAFTNFSAVVSTKNYITAYHCFRTDAGTSPIYIDFRDGTAGAVLWRTVLPPNGGSNSPACAGPALFKTSANTALAFDVSAATTTVYLNVSGYQSKV